LIPTASATWSRWQVCSGYNSTSLQKGLGHHNQSWTNSKPPWLLRV